MTDYYVRLEARLRRRVDTLITKLVAKDREYGSSWKARGGVGAFMMLARKWDRLQNAAQRHDPAWDILDLAQSDERDEGVLDDALDLVGYLLLVVDEATREPRVGVDRCQVWRVGHPADRQCELMAGHLGDCRFDTGELLPSIDEPAPREQAVEDLRERIADFARELQSANDSLADAEAQLDSATEHALAWQRAGLDALALLKATYHQAERYDPAMAETIARIEQLAVPPSERPGCGPDEEGPK